MVSARDLKVSFHVRTCPQGVASVLCKRTPIFGSRWSKLHHLTVSTVTAPNVIPHLNIKLFPEGLPIVIKSRPTEKNTGNKSIGKFLDLQIRYRSFIVPYTSKEATELSRKVSKFTRSKVRGIYGRSPSTLREDFIFGSGFFWPGR
jgi:hypothetical protein